VRKNRRSFFAPAHSYPLLAGTPPTLRQPSLPPIAAIILEHKGQLNGGFFDEGDAVDTRSGGRYARLSGDARGCTERTNTHRWMH
jgi:hypothetical protein